MEAISTFLYHSMMTGLLPVLSRGTSFRECHSYHHASRAVCECTRVCLFNKRYTSVTPAEGIILPHTDITGTYFKAKYCIFAVSSPFKKTHFVLVLYIHGCKPRCPRHLSGINQTMKMLTEVGTFTLQPGDIITSTS